ncbi:unnamed protein product [Tetraodon nigroviridis]|uniref:(spotted green pufferfish) hypothetical protein n=1 Tax=Tetraodon nigroviridis TaxID=99883 RepID=Q4RQ02_TETNG|nr:unnamed protein product [Tetraodon nigroviridis]
MSRLVKKSPSVCTDLPLDSTDTRKKLRILLQLLKSCIGPKGRLKLIHNNIGGNVMNHLNILGPPLGDFLHAASR